MTQVTPKIRDCLFGTTLSQLSGKIGFAAISDRHPTDSAVLAGLRVVGAARARGVLAGKTSAQPRGDALGKSAPDAGALPAHRSGQRVAAAPALVRPHGDRGLAGPGFFAGGTERSEAILPPTHRSRTSLQGIDSLPPPFPLAPRVRLTSCGMRSSPFLLAVGISVRARRIMDRRRE